MIYTKHFALACAVTAAILWTVCSAAVSLMPQGMMQMTAHMLHTDLSQTTWSLSWPGFCLGLASWSIFSALTGALLAGIYNQFAISERLLASE